MNDAGLASNLQTIRPVMTDFLHWWSVGLAGLVPARTKRLLSTQRPSVIFSVSSEGTGVRLSGGFKHKTETIITPKLEADDSNALPRMAGRLRSAWRGREVVLGSPMLEAIS